MPYLFILYWICYLAYVSWYRNKMCLWHTIVLPQQQSQKKIFWTVSSQSHTELRNRMKGFQQWSMNTKYEICISQNSKVTITGKFYNRDNKNRSSAVKNSMIFSFLDLNLKLEWGCPNGTKYPPRQPIQTLQVMHQIREAVMRQKPFSAIPALWPWPLTFWTQSP